MRTSIGYHTFTISRTLTQEDADKLWGDIKRYKNYSGEIEIIKRESYKNDPNARHYSVVYPKLFKGISWEMRFSNRGFCKDGEFTPCSIKATINPKIFTGEKNYITAADMSYIAEVEDAFNQEAVKISPLLGHFNQYSINRLDYCINFDLSELDIEIQSNSSEELPKMIMQLIKMGDIPEHYRLKDYEEEYEFYLKCGSVVINCYWKHIDLLHNFYDCPDLNESRNIIRFEIQYRYPKAYIAASKIKKKNAQKRVILKEKMREKGVFEFVEDNPKHTNKDEMIVDNVRIDTMRSVLEELTSDDCCAEVIEKYFENVIGAGDYYTFTAAKRIIEAKVNSWEKILRLTHALEMVQNYKGIARTKAILQGKALEDFRRSLRELAQLNVNPIIIPDEWGIEFIPGLLNNYYQKRAEERKKIENDRFKQHLLREYIEDCRKHETPWI